MGTSHGASPSARQRALELRRSLCFRLVDGASSLGSTRAERAFTLLAVCAYGLLAWLMVCTWRAQMLHWAPGPHWAAALLPLALSGLGGLWLIGAATLGYAWPERMQRAGVNNSRPLVELLPLGRRELLLAKLQGRTAAFVLHAAAAWALLLAARLLLLRACLLAAAPPLLDPWLPGAACLYAAALIASTRSAAAARLFSAAQGAGVGCSTILAGLAAIGVGYVLHLLPTGPAAYAALPAAVLAGVAANSLRPLRAATASAWQERPLGEMLHLSGSGPARELLRTAAKVYRAVAVRQVGASRDARFAWTAGEAPLLAALLLLAAAAVAAIAAGAAALAAWPSEAGAEFLNFALLLLGMLFAGLVYTAGQLSWPLLMPQARRLRQATARRYYTAPHLDHLLPEPPAGVWVRRLSATLATAALPVAAGVAAGAALRLLLPRLPAAALEPAMCAAPLGYGLCACFAAPLVCAYAPLLHCVARVVHLPRLAVIGLLYGSAFAGLLFGVLVLLPDAFSHHGSPVGLATVAVGSALLVVPAVFVISRRWCDPAGWTLDARGRPSDRSAMRAGVVLDSLSLLGASAAGALLGGMVLVEYLLHS